MKEKEANSWASKEISRLLNEDLKNYNEKPTAVSIVNVRDEDVYNAFIKSLTLIK